MNNLHGYHDKNSRVAGLWNIIECVTLSGTSEATGIEGTEFLLTDGGDVTWKVKEGSQNLPLFECQMYELYTYQNLQCYVNKTLIRFVGYEGHTIEFRLDQPVMSEDLMLLTYDGWFMLQCEKLPCPKSEPYQPYTLLSALHEEFFTDMKVTSRSKKEFPCHAIVLEASFPSFSWKNESNPPNFWNKLDDDVVEVVLHYVYSRTLPSNLLLGTARKCITSTEEIPDLENFRSYCHIFWRNICFRNNFISIVHTVHESLKNILHLFSSSPLSSSPSQIVSNLKLALKHLAIGIVKVLEVCMEYEKASAILVLAEQKELMNYLRLHVPNLLNKVIDILICVKDILVSMTTHTRNELAVLLVPEIQCAFYAIVYDVTTLRKSLEQIIQVSSITMELDHCSQTLLSSTLRHDLHLRELQKLRILQENLSSFTNSILYKKDEFEETESDARIRGVARMLELTAPELRDLILRLQELLQAIDELFDWSEFKFVFKGATSKIRRIIEKLSNHSEIIDSLIQDLVEIVNDSAFTDTLVYLGFFKKPQENESSKVQGDSRNERDGPQPECYSNQNSPQPECYSNQNPPQPECYSNQNPPNIFVPYGKEFGKSDVSKKFSEISLDDNLEDLKQKSCRIESHPVHQSEEGQVNYRDCSSCEELPHYLEEEAKKLNLVKRVTSIPSGSESKLASSLVYYLESGHRSDMTFSVIPPLDDEEEYSNSSSCDSVSTSSPLKEVHCSKPLSEFLSSTSDSTDKLECPLISSAPRHTIRKVRKSFSLDRPLHRHPSSAIGSSVLTRRSNIGFRQSLSLDATSDQMEEVTKIGKDSSLRHRGCLPSANSDSYEESSTTLEPETSLTKDSTDSVFDSPSLSLESHYHPYTALKSTKPLLISGISDPKCSIELKAHRMVIAARCEWFKRALMSGMREAIDRHIEVPGVSLNVFKLFLAFLYQGYVDLDVLQLNDLVDLLVVVDHYGVDSLKLLIEQHLETKVDDDSAFPLMVVAYHCNAPKLKDICLQQCALKRNYEMLNHLPLELRQQLVSTITSLKNWHRHGLENGLIEFSCEGDNICEGGWDSPTSLDPLIDDECSSLLTGMQDSGSSSEENVCLGVTFSKK